MSAPAIWIIAPIIISFGMIAARRHYRIINLAQVSICILLIILLAFVRFGIAVPAGGFAISIEPTLDFLGRSFRFQDTDRIIIAFFYLILAIISLVLLVSKVHSKIVPLGLALIGMLLAAIAVEPFLYSAFIIEIAVIIGMILVVDLRLRKTKGIMRFLIFFSLGMPFILLAGWYLAGGETSPVSESQLIQATLLLGLGFLFWLAVFPFHSWIPLIAEEAEIPEGIFLLSIFPFAIFIILLKYLNGFAWLREYSLIYQAFTILGTIMTGFGSVWAAFQENIKKMIGYLTITFTGLSLIALGLNSRQGFLVFSDLLLPRASSYILLSSAFLSIGKEHQIEKISDLQSAFHFYPIPAIAILTAFFSLVGMPLTAGFIPMQELYQATAGDDFRITVIILLSNAILTFVFFRLLATMTHPVDEEVLEENTIERNLGFDILLVIMIAFVIINGLNPNLLYPKLSQLLSSFEFLVR